MKVTLTIREEDLGTIVTALMIELNRVRSEGDTESEERISSAIDAIDKNTYAANVMDVK